MSRHRSSEEYDAIIIGAGIGGLVCGCYLAKAGMKVLICEQHHKPGGYCTSFKRKGFTFDAAPHCFGSYRKGGIMYKILKDLNIYDSLKIFRPDPTDIIVLPDHKISFHQNLEETIESFYVYFPKEINGIKQLFALMLNTDPTSFSKLRKISFKELLDIYLTNETLKTIISYPILAISGLVSSNISAFVGAKLYSEFLFDGGYYPEDGMQALSNSLAKQFLNYGGHLRLSTLVKKVKIKDKEVIGIYTDKYGYIPGRIVISNCDARQTFFKLIGKDILPKFFLETIKNMTPSHSNYILYLGLDKSIKPQINIGSAIYFYSHYDIEKSYNAIKKGNLEEYGGFALRISYKKDSIYAGIPAAFKNKKYWSEKKYIIMDKFIDKIQKFLIPDISKFLIYKDAATPYTMYRYTLNYKGASYGWAAIPSQFAVPGMRKPSFIKNLYLVGHWTTLGVGISGAAYVGYDTAKIITKANIKNAK